MHMKDNLFPLGSAIERFCLHSPLYVQMQNFQGEIDGLQVDRTKPKPRRKRSTCVHCGKGFISVLQTNGFYTSLCDKCYEELAKKHGWRMRHA